MNWVLNGGKILYLLLLFILFWSVMSEYRDDFTVVLVPSMEEHHYKSMGAAITGSVNGRWTDTTFDWVDNNRWRRSHCLIEHMYARGRKRLASHAALVTVNKVSICYGAPISAVDFRRTISWMLSFTVGISAKSSKNTREYRTKPAHAYYALMQLINRCLAHIDMYN